MDSRTTKIIQLSVIIITVLAAIIIFSMTLGRDFVEGRNQSIESFALLHFSGYLFFLLMPVEMSFIYCALNQPNIFLIIAIAMATAMVAQLIDYLIGYSLSSKFINTYFNQKKNERAIGYIKSYGSITIFIFNLLPLSSPIIALAAGMIKYPFKKVFFFSTAGLLIKYIVIGLFIYF